MKAWQVSMRAHVRAGINQQMQKTRQITEYDVEDVVNAVADELYHWSELHGVKESLDSRPREGLDTHRMP